MKKEFLFVVVFAFVFSDGSLEKFVNQVIRPRRSLYDGSAFKDGKFSLTGNADVNLKNFKVKNRKNLSLNCILTYPVEVNLENVSSLPLVIYSHGNGGDIRDGLFVLSHYFPHLCGISFDFSGCGNGESKYVTLGWEEQYDLLSVVNYARDVLNFSEIGLYGRSMGAASSLLYLGLVSPTQTLVKGIVLDSPFAHLSALVDVFAKYSFWNLNKTEASSAVLEGYRIVKEKTGLIINELNPVDCARTSNTPVLILHGHDDTLIPIAQSKEILKEYRCPDKNMISFAGGHNSPRDGSVMHAVRDFFDRVFVLKNNVSEKKDPHEL